MKGGTRCRMHGGAAPKARQAAARRIAEQQMNGALARLDVEPVENPLLALQTLAGQALAWQQEWAAKVNELKQLRYTSEAGGEQLRAEIAAYERAMDRCASILTSIAKLDIDARLVKIEEAKAEVVVKAIEAALTVAGVTGTAAAEARKAAVRHLYAVS
jgi:autotransporter translocation and assembly factor TamB